MARLTADVEGVDKTLTSIKRDLHRGMEKSADRLAEIGKEEARTVLELHDRIFNRDVYRKFRTATVDDNPAHIRLKLINYADHAGAVEWGVSAAEYADGGPPVQALLPWVERKMGGSFGTFDDGSNSGGGSSPSTTNREWDDDSAGGLQPWKSNYTGGNNRQINPSGDHFERVEEDPSNYSEGDLVKVGLKDSYGGSVYTVESVTDEKITFLGKTYEYTFNDTEGSIESIYRKHHVPNLHDLKEDEQVIVNGNRVGPDAWDGKYVYVVLDEVVQHDDGYWNITGHDINGGWSNVDITTESILTYRPSRSSSWEVRHHGTGKKVEYWNPDSNKFETGWIENKDSTDKDWQANQGIHVRSSGENGYIRKQVSADQIRTIYEENRTNTNKQDVPDHDYLDGSNISQADIGDVKQGKRYLLWHKQDGKFLNGIAYSSKSSRASFNIKNEIRSKVKANEDDSLEDDLNAVEVIGEYDEVRGLDNSVPLDENNDNLLFYGQHITIEKDGEQDDAVVTDWDYDTVYIEETDLADTAQRRPNVLNDAEIIEVQDWDELSKDEKREQIYGEIRYRTNIESIYEEFSEAAAEWFSQDWFDSLKNPDYALKTLTHINTLSDNPGPRAAGKVSTSYWQDTYFDVSIKSELTDNIFTGLREETSHHEMGHALLIRHWLDHNGYGLAAEYANEFPENLGFKEDGSFDSSLITDDDVSHLSLEKYYIKDEFTNTHLNPTDFKNVDPFDGFSDVTDPDSISWDESVSDTDLFDPDNTQLSVGDIVKYTEDYGKERILVYKGSAPTHADDNEWNFIDLDKKWDKRLKTDSDGNLTDGEITGYKEADKEPTRSEFTSDYEDNLLQLAAASNHAMKQQLWTMQHDSTSDNINSNADNILRPYTAMNSHETIAGLLSIIHSDNYSKVQELRQVKKMHPGLLKSMLRIYNPSETAKSYLKEYDDLEEYL